MDRVRLGRVLGRGARMAARTVYDAVDAASSSAPSRATSPGPRFSPSSAPQTQRNSAATTARSPLQQAVRSAGKVTSSARAAKQGVFAPVKRASRAVSLEIAGSFFALFALSFSVAAWRFRGLGFGSASQRLWIYVGFAALFAYFALSSFLRARRISQG